MVDKPFSSPLSRQQLSDRTHRRLSFMRKDPTTNAIVDKLVTSLTPHRTDRNGNREVSAPAEHLIAKLSDSTATNITDSESLLQILPDLKHAMNILVSSIISPNDMVNTELNFTLYDSELPSELAQAMLTVISDYFKNDYKIEQDLPKMLENALFKKGAYPLLVLPESTIDEVINSPFRVTVENIAERLSINGDLNWRGILGPTNDQKNAAQRKRMTDIERNVFSMLGLENMTIDIDKTVDGVVVKVDNVPLVKVADNTDALKIPLVKNKLVRDRADSLVRGELGNRDGQLSASQLEQSIYKARQYNQAPVVSLKTLTDLDKPTVGHPLVMLLPAESVIPVHVPGNPEDHVGYFVLLDRTGNPVNRAEYLNFYNDLSLNTTQNREMVSQLIQGTRRQMQGNGDNMYNYLDKEAAVMAYTEMIENDLLERLKNGIYGDTVEVSRPTEVYRIMFARALAKQLTQILYVPKSLITYIAFDYNMWGVGKSLLEDTKILGSLRAMLLFANTMAEIKNSVNRERLIIDLDPNDPDPGRTVEFLYTEYARNRQSSFPIGASNPLDVVKFLQNAGVSMQVSGHDGYPQTKFDVESVNHDRKEVDNDLSDELKKRHIQALGIPPEAVDKVAEGEFATTIVRNNLIFTKTVTLYQQKFTAHIEDFARKYTLNDAILKNKLKKCISDHESKLSDILKKGGNEKILSIFIAALKASLPAPDTVQIEAQLQAFQSYSDALDKTLDAYLGSEFLTGSVLGELADTIPQTKAALKAKFQRDWMRKNNMLPELNDLVTWSEEDGPAVNLMKEYDGHIEGIRKALEEFMKKVAGNREASNKEMDEAGGVGDTTANGGSSLSGGGDLSGGEDFDLESTDLDEGGETKNEGGGAGGTLEEESEGGDTGTGGSSDFGLEE